MSLCTNDEVRVTSVPQYSNQSVIQECITYSIYIYIYIYIESVLLTQYCAGDKIEKNEMGWACGLYRGGEGGV